jgi:hypothetical protein
VNIDTVAWTPTEERAVTSITISLSDEQLVRLRELAKETDLEPDELLRATVEAWLTQPDAVFARAAKHVLQRNAELYRRLA